MRVFTLITLGLATLGLASPSYKGGDNGQRQDKDGDRGNNHGPSHCITRPEARDLAQAYAALIGAFREPDAQHWLAIDFVDYSDSINTFVNKPLGSVTFNKTSFIASQSSSTLPTTPVTVVGEPVVECNRVAIMWTSTFGKGWVAKGITVVEVRENGSGDGKSKWLMTRWDVEFNSLVWAYDMGQYYCLFGQPFGDPSVCSAPQARRGLEWE